MARVGRGIGRSRSSSAWRAGVAHLTLREVPSSRGRVHPGGQRGDRVSLENVTATIVNTLHDEKHDTPEQRAALGPRAEGGAMDPGPWRSDAAAMATLFPEAGW